MEKELKKYLIEQCREWMLPEELGTGQIYRQYDKCSMLNDKCSMTNDKCSMINDKFVQTKNEP